MSSSFTSNPACTVASSPTALSVKTPCAACKLLRRKCNPDCIFAPYFPPDQQEKFIQVHRVYGASNVSKMLKNLHPGERTDAVRSLVYEADIRLRFPVEGCYGIIAVLQHQLSQIQADLQRAKFELSRNQPDAAVTASFAPGGGNFINMHPFSVDMGGYTYQHSQMMAAGIVAGHGANDAGALAAMNAGQGANDAGALAAMNVSGIVPVSCPVMQSSTDCLDEKPWIGPL